MNSEATTDIFEGFTPQEQSALDAMRAWTSSIERPNQTISIAGKLDLIQSQLDSGQVKATDSWKLGALGLLFGDALYQSTEGKLKWVMVHDSAGTSPALRWKATRFLIFPTTALRKPIEAGEAFDIRALFREYTRSLPFYPR